MAADVDWTQLAVPGAFVLGFVVACAVVVRLVDYLRRRDR